MSKNFSASTCQIVLLFLVILGLSTLYEARFGDGRNMDGVLTPLPYSLYAMEITSFILTAVILIFWRRKYRWAILPWVVCGVVSLALVVYWRVTLGYLILSYHGSIVGFLQNALGAHNGDSIDPSLESMWPTFWRFQSPFGIALAIGYLIFFGRYVFRRSRGLSKG
jgi:hypothetical protein